MSGFDKILNFMKLNDDDYEDDYEEEELVIKKPRNSKSSKVMDDLANTRPIAPSKAEKQVKQPKNTRANIVPISTRTTSKGMEVFIIKPTSYDEVTEVTDVLLNGRAVVINLEGIDVDLAQRIVDFVSGSCYAMKGNFQKISSYIFIVTPDSIDISGDFQEILAGGFEVPTLNSDF